jgi:cytochrome d ubiquinol oxidase subunit II
MELFWFWSVAGMIALYVILDGFDLGAGILHLLIGKTEEERHTIIKAIGPVWDGNEVWLLAAGGTLYFAFPRVYASSFSGFYLPLMIVLWLLMLRGLGIELRHQLHHPLWISFWDAVFSGASLLLTIFFGAALGNVVRGVPLDDKGYFFAPLWTTFTVVPESGILDWFTVTMGLVALSTLTMHGAHYIALKTDGALRERARRYAALALAGTVLFSLSAMASTFFIHPELWNNFALHPSGILFPLAAVAGLAGAFAFQRSGRDGAAFLSSALFIAGMLASTAFGLFPKMLPASTDPSRSLTAYNSAAGAYGLEVGLVWWLVGMALAGGYFIFMYRSFRGKVLPGQNEGGY